MLNTKKFPSISPENFFFLIFDNDQSSWKSSREGLSLKHL